MSIFHGLYLLLAVLHTSHANILSNIQVRYGTVTYAPSGGYLSSVNLTNNGTTDIDTGGDNVTIYTCLIRLVVGSNKAAGMQVHDSPIIKAYHLDGCAHKLVISAPFQLAAGTSLIFELKQEFWSVAYTDVMPNWYIQLGDADLQLISNTNQPSTEFVDPYDTREKYLRTAFDRVLPLTLEERYEQQVKVNTVSKEAVQTRLIPDILQPVTIDSDTKQLTVTSDVPNGLPSVTYDVDSTLTKGQFVLKVEDVSDVAKITISTATNSTQDTNVAMSTLVQLVERFHGFVPVGSYKSKAPRFEYRGHMLDVARQFHNKDVIKRQLDLMWRYKLNVLHIHLVDDESWALEITDIPELTEIGSKQCYNLQECATYPQLGRKISATERQYLTKEDYVEIVSYAESLGITVLPEIELPGHSTAAINAMRVRYENSPTAEDYRLHDPEDTSAYQSVQYFTQGAMNPCVDSMFAFVEKVIGTIQGYHEEAGQVLQTIHLAGDEVSGGAWTASPACNNLTSDIAEGSKVNAVKVHMLRNLGLIGERLNVSLAFWEDGLNNVSSLPYVKDEIFPSSVDVYGFAWQAVWEWGGGKRPFNMANSGYKVVLAPATRFYLDHAQEPHPEERGFYWARRSSNLQRVFSFRPINYYANIDGLDGFGTPLSQATFCTPEKCPPLLNPENIVGVEAPLFGETIQNQSHIDNNVWPRLLAVAERAWVEGDWEKEDGPAPEGLQEDFDEFRQAVEEYEINHIEHNSVAYHISPPGAQITKEDSNSYILQLSVEFKHQRVWWREENSKDFVEAENFTIKRQKDSKNIYLKTSNADATRYSYEVVHEAVATPVSHSPVKVTSIGLLLYAFLFALSLNML